MIELKRIYGNRASPFWAILAYTSHSNKPPVTCIWGFWDFTSVNVELAIVTWSFLGGGATALFVGARAGIAANNREPDQRDPGDPHHLRPVGEVRTPAVHGPEERLRHEWFALLVFLIFPPLIVGWNAILAIMFGRAATNVSNAFFSANYFDPNGPLVVGFALTAIAISWWILYKGPASIDWVNKFVASSPPSPFNR